MILGINLNLPVLHSVIYIIAELTVIPPSLHPQPITLPQHTLSVTASTIPRSVFCFAIVHNLCSTEIQICAMNFYWEYDDKCKSIIIADENYINSGCIIYLVSIAVFMSTISLLQVLKFASNKMCTLLHHNSYYRYRYC